MDQMFGYLQHDMNVILTVAALCAAICLFAVWKFVADLRSGTAADRDDRKT